MHWAAVTAALVAASTACRDADSPTEPGLSESFSRAAAVPEESYIVVFKESTREVPEQATRLAADHGGRISRVYQHSIKGFAASLPVEALEELRRDPSVAFVEPDHVLTLANTQGFAPWGLDRIDQRKLPLNTTYAYSGDGTGVTVYIIDTGIRTTHEEFGGRATSGFSAVGEPDGSYACYWHGTHVAGAVGGATYGVAKGVSLVGVQVFDCDGKGTVSTAIAGVEWVTANHVKPAVANMSLAGSASRALDQAVANSIAAGVTYVVAAGNEQTDACKYSPARAAAAITVGSTTASDARAATSNYGGCLDLFAPGDNIPSPSAWSDVSTANMGGTSMAAPHVAGVAALVLQGDSRTTPSLVTQAILSNATKGKLTGIGRSPNRLLHSGFLRAGFTP